MDRNETDLYSLALDVDVAQDQLTFESAGVIKGGHVRPVVQREGRWTVHTTYDDRNVKVSVAWTATDSVYTVRRAPGNQFVVENASGDFVGAHGMLSDALDDIQELEAEKAETDEHARQFALVQDDEADL